MPDLPALSLPICGVVTNKASGLVSGAPNRLPLATACTVL